jgi:hypothetical protein
MEASVMAPIFLLKDLGTGIVPQLFPEGRGIGFGTSDGLYAVVASVMAPIFSLRDLGTGIVTQLFLRAEVHVLGCQMDSMQCSFPTSA